MSVFITTHNANGKAIFSQRGLEEPPKIPIPPGYIQFLSATNETSIDLSTEQDLDAYQNSRTAPFFGGSRRICPDNGTATCIMSMKPGGGESPMHRTMTLDTVVMLEGNVEIELDSGEARLLKAGDAVVQRATIHRWRNVTPNGGWAKWVVFIQAVKEPVRIGDVELTGEWAH